MGLVCVLTIVLGVITIKVNSDQSVYLITDEYENDGLGNSKFTYDTSDKVSREETIKLLHKNLENEQISVSGYYYFTSPEGYRINVDYVADKSGFRPTLTIVRSVPSLKDRIPGSAVATLQGGGLG